jgi:type IV pilus assembly protein PilC
MLTYKYEARNTKTGETVKAEVQADNEQAAAKLVTEQGLTPISLQLSKTSAGGRFGRVKAKDRVLFSRQLSTLINAGLPLVQSLRSVASQTTNKTLKVIINQVISDVEAGTTFSVALSRFPKVFSNVYVALIAASEVSGTLDSGLERLADQQEKDADIVAKVRGAMTYPLIVLLVMMGVVTFMIVKVLPQVQSIYAGIHGAQLPLVTVILLAVSHFTVKYWWVVLVMFALSGFFGFRWLQTLGGRRVFDKVKMKAWPIGPLFMKMYMARFARTGTTLVSSGVPLLQMLQITGDAVNNLYISDSIHKAIDKVKGGKSLADALTGDPNFLELVPNMLRIGEQSGAMETMMAKVADYYEKEVDNQVKTISTIIEPVMMVIMGIVALIIVSAILLPIYGLVNQTGFGK